MDILAPLSSHDQVIYMQALIARANEDIIDIEEQMGASEYRRVWETYVMESRKLDLTRWRSGEYATRAAIRQCIKRVVSAAFTAEPEAVGTSVVRYRSEIGNFVIYTYFDWGGRAAALNYAHRIVFPGSDYPAHYAISICSWLGLSSQTAWSSITKEELPVVGEALARVCKHFLRGAEEFLGGVRANAS